METSFQIEREKAVLVIIDVQEALVKAMDSGVARNLIRNLQTLIAFAKEMGIPMVMTEQYPRGLGMTIPEIKQGLPSLRLKRFPSAAVASMPSMRDSMAQEED